MQKENRKKLTPDELFKEIDINYVNHNIMLTSKTPAYVIIFYFGSILIPLTFQNLNMFLISIFITISIHILSKKLQANNQKFGYIFSIFKYMFMPRFFLLKPLEKNKKKKKGSK